MSPAAQRASFDANGEVELDRKSGIGIDSIESSNSANTKNPKVKCSQKKIVTITQPVASPFQNPANPGQEVKIRVLDVFLGLSPKSRTGFQGLSVGDRVIVAVQSGDGEGDSGCLVSLGRTSFGRAAASLGFQFETGLGGDWDGWMDWDEWIRMAERLEPFALEPLRRCGQGLSA